LISLNADPRMDIRNSRAIAVPGITIDWEEVLVKIS